MPRKTTKKPTLAQYQTRLFKAAKEIALIRERLWSEADYPDDFRYEWRAEIDTYGELELETQSTVCYFNPLSFDQSDLNTLKVIEEHIKQANDPKAALRKSALEKLTPEEREALGV